MFNLKSTTNNLILILLLIFGYGYAQDVSYEYSNEGVNKFDDNGRQGVWLIYNKIDSVVISMHHFVNDTLQGYFECYFNNGQISEKGYYKEGKLDSIVIAYWSNGMIRAEIPFSEGKLNGVATSYDENGNIVLRNRYFNGKKDTMYGFEIFNPLYYSDYLHPSYIKSYLIMESNKYFSPIKILHDTVYKYISETLTYVEIYKNGILCKQTQLNNGYVYKDIYFTNNKVDKMNIYYENSNMVRYEIFKCQDQKNYLWMGCYHIKVYDLKGILKYEFEKIY
jgi:antitoxin component YwqK of YwqJK toxin-antitoxin module